MFNCLSICLSGYSEAGFLTAECFAGYCAGWLSGLLAGCASQFKVAARQFGFVSQLKVAAWLAGFTTQLKVAARLKNGFKRPWQRWRVSGPLSEKYLMKTGKKITYSNVIMEFVEKMGNSPQEMWILLGGNTYLFKEKVNKGVVYSWDLYQTCICFDDEATLNNIKILNITFSKYKLLKFLYNFACLVY